MGSNNWAQSQSFSRLNQEITTPEDTSTSNIVSNLRTPVPTNTQLGSSSDQVASTSNPTGRQMQREANQLEIDLNRTDSDLALYRRLHGNISSISRRFISIGVKPYIGTSKRRRRRIGPHNSSAASNSSQHIDKMTEELGKAIRLNYDESRVCRCPRSKCLNLCCNCFSTAMYCGESCKCKECNNSKRSDRIVEQSRRCILADNPFAFVPNPIASRSATSTIAENGSQLPLDLDRRKRGCSCKIKCTRQNCRCLKAKVGCSGECKCNDCQNSYGKRQVTDRSMKILSGNDEGNETNGNKDFPDSSSSNQ